MLEIMGTDEVIALANSEQNAIDELEKANNAQMYSSLASEIIRTFTENRDAKRSSGIEDEILDSLRAYNGEYSQKDLGRIKQEGGSEIFMNLTATKCKVAKSWITDILKPAHGPIATIEPTSMPSLPKAMIDQIEKSIKEEAALMQQEEQEAKEAQQKAQQGQPQGPPAQGDVGGLPQPGPVPGGLPPTGQPKRPRSRVEEAQEAIKDTNARRRDIRSAILEEIQKEARFQLKEMETMCLDQLQEGGWDAALSSFIQDFVIFPTAFMKGPVITKEKRLTWENGQPVVTQDYTFKNLRVNPLDIYPSANATSIQDGKLIEHVRYSMKDIQALKGLPGYNDLAIEEILEGNVGTYSWIDTGIESEKAEEELRGTEHYANEDVVHGLHFFGPMKVEKIRSWMSPEMEDPCLGYMDEELVDVEAILVGNEVIKCVINDDPLGRRPYYKASFMDRPGSFWGRALPEMMGDIQRMCNACARALSNNLAIASGPQVEAYVDRLADNGDLEDIYPMKIWQLMSDPTGAGGRAINWFQPTSNAGELLKVYAEFEARADDVTGIPKYAYGNEKTAGAGTTASGMSMLLENASKPIKDAIRSIDEGLIKPRLEMQFYYNLIKNPDLNYTGDVNIVPRGSSALTIKGAEALRRNEFLQITANPVDQKIMGMEGRANILRKMSEDLGLIDNIIPSALELKKVQAKDEENMAAQQQMMQQIEEAKKQTSLQATTIQIEGQERMAALVQQLKSFELQMKDQHKKADQQIKIAELQTKQKGTNEKNVTDLKQTTIKEASASARQAQEIALKQRQGSGI